MTHYHVQECDGEALRQAGFEPWLTTVVCPSEGSASSHQGLVLSEGCRIAYSVEETGSEGSALQGMCVTVWQHLPGRIPLAAGAAVAVANVLVSGASDGVIVSVIIREAYWAGKGAVASMFTPLSDIELLALAWEE